MSEETEAAIDTSVNYNDNTSPSQLQEVTLDSEITFTNSIDVGAPGNGPVRGRSVRDIEDQLTSLKKENFNLKLRIYFLEERMGTNFNLDKESAVKKNVELMVEVETLRKELQEKQDLLCQAVKAMELEEDEHKKETKQKEQQITEYQEQIDELLAKIQDLKSDYNYSNKLQQGDSEITNFLYPHTLLPDANNVDIIKELQTKIEELQCELVKEKENSATLENLLQIADCASIRCKSLEEESVQKDKKINELHKEIHEYAKKVSSSNLRIQSLEDELSQTNSELQYKTHELQNIQHELKNHLVEIEQLKKLLSQTQLMYESEQRKGEKLKAAVMARNSKVIELENLGETQKAKIRNLETRLESAQNEVKRKTDELAAIKSPVRRQKTPNTDDNSFSVQDTSEVSGSPNDKKNNQKIPVKSHSPSVSSSHSPTVSSSRSPVKKTQKNGEILQSPDVKILVEENQKQKEDITAQQQKILKLKTEQFKACQIIKSMINTRGENEKEIEYLRKRVEELEEQICSIREEKEKLSGNGKESGISLKSKLSEMKFTAITNPAAENENTMANEGGHLTKHYKKHITDLEKQIGTLLDTIKEKDAQIKRLITQMHEISKNLKSKDNMIVDLEFELLSANHGMASMNISSQTECQESERMNSAWIAEIESKNKEIERLESELRKRTCDLQGIVNKELWEKNREIEKLQNRYENIVLAKEQEIANLEEAISGKDLQFKLLKDEIKELGNQISLSASEDSSLAKTESSTSDETKTVQERIIALLEERKLLLQQIDELKQKLLNVPDHNTKQLKTEYKELREELDKSEKLRSETNEICIILSNRLEELAQFLNSLLKQKLVLGLLGFEQNSKLQEIVNQSLDLSHTLNTTLMLNPDQSLVQLSNISELLDISKRQSLNVSEFFKEDQKSNEVLSINPENATLTYQNHLIRANCDEKKDITKDEVIKVLREQVEDLKHEIEIRDLEFDQITSNHLPNKSGLSTKTKNLHENASESESWSEPDRFVSLARIGLNDGILKPPTTDRSKPYDSDSTESEVSNEFAYSPKKQHSASKNTHQTILILHKQVIELEAKLRDKDKQILSEQLACIEIQRQLKMSEEKIKSCENSLKEAEEKVIQLNKVITELQQLQKTLEEKLISKDKIAQNKINMLESEKEQAMNTLKISEEIAENAKMSLRNAEKQIRILENQIEQNEIDALSRFQMAQKEFEDKIEQIEHSAETQIKKIKESVEQMEIIYKRDYVKKSEIDERFGNIDEIVNELENYKILLKDADEKVHLMEDKERELKQNIQVIEKEYQEKVNNIRKDLDNATLQYSETVLEKTKIASEKAALEQQLKKLDSRDGELLKQVGDIHDEFTSVKQAFQMQVANLENQKSKLEMKVSELESKNAELVNRLIKLQTGHGDNMHLSTSVPASPNRYYEIYGNSALFQMPEYRRQFSDNTRYAYMSDNAGDDHNRSELSDFGIMQLLKSPVDHERNQSNSSPDLGIESDHGRFSSLEANIYVPRPLQATLALTESMSNLLDGDNNTCNSEQCCQKVKQMAHENADLKKRLLRTRRALEETITQLSLANQRKKQVEKTICKQIHKTSQVLRKAKANLDSGSESDVLRKN